MIETILSIGKAISKGRDPWEDVLAPPKADDKEGKLRLYQIGITFDLDEQQVLIRLQDLSEFDSSLPSLKALGSLKIKSGNNKSLYPCVDASKVVQLVKTLFGKPGADKGEMLEKIETDYPEIAGLQLSKCLQAIFNLRHSFDEWFPLDAKENISLDKLVNHLSLEKAGKLVMIYAQVKWESEGLSAKPLAQLDGFSELIEKEFIKTPEAPSSDVPAAIGKLCYISGKIQNDVQTAEFGERYNINKIFVQTTLNYATGFDPNKYHQNYQASASLQKMLDRGSIHLLKKKFLVEIADWPHAIIPQVFSSDLEKVGLHQLETLQSKSDLLFSLKKLDGLVTELTDEGVQAVWLNYVGIESDGKYFKINNLIKDVPLLHVTDLLKTMDQTHALFKPWIGELHKFNLGMMYGAIPVRKNQKQNPALQLFAAILEQRKVDVRVLMQHYTELILCYRFGRYKAYANIYDSKKEDNFDFLAKDATFRYLAFLHVLRQLHQLNDSDNSKLENGNPMDNPEKQDNLSKVEAFFQKLHYTEEQKALFYLGRAMNSIAAAQDSKGLKKRVLEKVNYNGMDEKSLFRLHNDLFEKAKQHDKMDDLIWDLKGFNSRFQIGTWKMNPQEALFYLLAGYTYRIRSKANNSDPQPSTETE